MPDFFLKNKGKAIKLWEILMSILAVISIVMVILDFSSVISLMSFPYHLIDLAILIIFAADYIFRLLKADDKLVFLKKNIFDLIAIIPFNTIFSFFRIARIFRFARFAKMLRFVKLIAFFNVAKKRLSDFLKTNGFIYVLSSSVVLIFISAFIMMFIEHQSFADALWWSIVTCTTVGYGDISPSTGAGRAIAVILMIFGIGMIGMLTGTITTYFTNIKKSTPKDCEELMKIIENMDEAEKEKLIEIAKIIIK